MNRKERNHLPVVVDAKNNKYLQALEKGNTNFPYYYFGSFLFFAIGCHQYAKSYYPYGIIVRRSINVSPAQKAGYYLPLLSFFAYAWWA